MPLDGLMAVLHHLAVFALFGLLAAEIACLGGLPPTIQYLRRRRDARRSAVLARRRRRRVGAPVAMAPGGSARAVADLRGGHGARLRLLKPDLADRRKERYNEKTRRKRPHVRDDGRRSLSRARRRADLARQRAGALPRRTLRWMASFVDSELAGAAGFADLINAAPGLKERIAAAAHRAGEDRPRRARARRHGRVRRRRSPLRRASAVGGARFARRRRSARSGTAATCGCRCFTIRCKAGSTRSSSMC